MELQKQSYSEVLVIPGSWLEKEELRGEGITVQVARAEFVRVEGDMEPAAKVRTEWDQ